MKQWQQDMMKSEKLVHVTGFQLRPQADGFWLQVEFYIADKHDPELGSPFMDFFGTLDDCFSGAINHLAEERKRLRKRL